MQIFFLDSPIPSERHTSKTHIHNHKTTAKQTVAMSPWGGSPCNSHPPNQPLNSSTMDTSCCWWWRSEGGQGTKSNANLTNSSHQVTLKTAWNDQCVRGQSSCQWLEIFCKKNGSKILALYYPLKWWLFQNRNFFFYVEKNTTIY